MKTDRNIAANGNALANTLTYYERMEGLEHVISHESDWDRAQAAQRQYDELKRVTDLWDELGDLPMDPETECMEAPFQGFPAGTHREDIWHWFEETFHLSVATDLMGV